MSPLPSHPNAPVPQGLPSQPRAVPRPTQPPIMPPARTGTPAAPSVFDDDSVDFNVGNEEYGGDESSYVQHWDGEEQPSGGSHGGKVVYSHGNTVDLSERYGDFDEVTIQNWELLLAYIADDVHNEILLNGPVEILGVKSGQRFALPVEFPSTETYHQVIDSLLLPLTDTYERIGDNKVMIEGQLELDDGDPDLLPLLARVHLMGPPATSHAVVTIAKKSRTGLTLDEITASGAITPKMCQFLKAIARARATTVFSGLSGAGKTTMLEAITHEFDQYDRVAVIEDVPELRLTTADTIYMKSLKRKPGVPAEDEISLAFLVSQANRQRLNRIIVGEIRDSEMSEFLIAANSGAEGSMTTLHADNPKKTLDKIRLLASKATHVTNEASLQREIASTIQIIVQLSKIDGKHVVTHIEEVTPVVTSSTGMIQTSPIFGYDRSTKTHFVAGRPTDALVGYMRNRGVEIDNQWFM